MPRPWGCPACGGRPPAQSATRAGARCGTRTVSAGSATRGTVLGRAELGRHRQPAPCDAVTVEVPARPMRRTRRDRRDEEWFQRGGCGVLACGFHGPVDGRNVTAYPDPEGGPRKGCHHHVSGPTAVATGVHGPAPRPEGCGRTRDAPRPTAPARPARTPGRRRGSAVPRRAPDAEARHAATLRGPPSRRQPGFPASRPSRGDGAVMGNLLQVQPVFADPRARGQRPATLTWRPLSPPGGRRSPAPFSRPAAAGGPWPGWR